MVVAKNLKDLGNILEVSAEKVGKRAKYKSTETEEEGKIFAKAIINEAIAALNNYGKDQQGRLKDECIKIKDTMKHLFSLSENKVKSLHTEVDSFGSHLSDLEKDSRSRVLQDVNEFEDKIDTAIETISKTIMEKLSKQIEEEIKKKAGAIERLAEIHIKQYVQDNFWSLIKSMVFKRRKNASSK